MSDSHRQIELILVEQEKSESQTAEVIVEAPVSLTVNGEVWLTFMCTPVDLEALAVGFLYNERLIDSMDEVADVRLCAAGDNVDVWLNHSVQKPDNWRRTSGCTGGFTSVGDEPRVPHPAGRRAANGFTITSAQVNELVGMLFSVQDLYQKTGGVHTSALSDGKQILVAAEDIGRHNSLDKIAGLCLLQDIHPSSRILLTTGRISSEMLQKAARIGAGVLISRTSPSSLSIQLAEDLGITLIGYARRTQFRIYAHPERITILHPVVLAREPG